MYETLFSLREYLNSIKKRQELILKAFPYSEILFKGRLYWNSGEKYKRWDNLKLKAIAGEKYN